jgi:hypothetical protein
MVQPNTSFYVKTDFGYSDKASGDLSQVKNPAFRSEK